MAIQFEKTTYPGNMDPFWRKEVRMLPGGFALKQTFNVGDVIQRGAFVAVDFDAMSAAIVKVAKVLSGGTTSKPRVSKKNNFVIGDVLMKLGVGTSSPYIKGIDRSNSEYDVLELSAAITGLAEGDFLQEATEYVAAGTDTEAVEAAPKYVANMMLGADLEIKKSGLPTIDAAYDCIVLKSVCTPFPASWLTDNSPCLATNHNILFINQ